LTDSQKRTEYDYMRYNQEAYFQTYGASVLWHYAPKSDATFIILMFIIAANAFTWVAQKHRWQMVADRLIKAACEDWSPSMGGTAESKHLREEALIVLQERGEGKDEEPAASNGKASKKGSRKISGKEKKRQEQEELKPIIAELVGKMNDFGAGFHKPTWRDLFLVRMAKFPFYLGAGVFWQTKYAIRRLQKKELNDEERSVLTERAVGHVAWDLAAEDERSSMIARELWVMDNLVKWKEEQEVKTWSKADQKYHAKMKKKGTKDL
jgi:DnaJ family protein C protein 25